MNELKALQSMGFTLPSPAFLLGAIVFGLLGMVAFSRGRKESLPMLTWPGLALMLYPYAISQTWLLWLIGVCVSAWVFAHWK
ncbi:MAG: hypothetical protein Q7T07_01080 [Burkholderiaceae bacterium]|nr:hypothetical protein [Burkholderiaceae bacterium]